MTELTIISMAIGIVAGAIAIFEKSFDLCVDMPVMLYHGINNYLAKPFDTSDFAAGINWVLSDENRHKELCIKAREKVVAPFDIKKIASQYKKLYQDLLNR